MRQTTGLLAGRYRLDSPIASGGVGEVWRAFDLVLNRAVAVKVLRSEYAGQRQALDRFRTEARHAGSVTHPALAQVYDYGEAGDTPFLVMELVDGPSLADVLEAGPLDPGTTMDVVAQAATGLQAAHAAGLVHRDIKPGNLLIGPGGQVKITDFGIAHAAGSVPITRTGMVIGTPSYLAPERAAGAEASPASDLYSLGIVAYECLAGEPPFRGMPFDVAAAHQHRDLPPLPFSMPAGAARLIAELTAKDPASRPASAAAVSAEAARVRDSLTGGAPSRLAATAQTPFRSDHADARGGTLVDAYPLSWQPSGPADRPGRGPRRGRVALLALGAALAGGLASWLIAAAVPAAQQSPPPPAASSPATQTVTVNSADLVGQQASDVTQTLCSLGLTPVVTFTSSSSQSGTGGGQDPGTVISVAPSGPVPIGSPVTMTVIQGRHHDLANLGNGGGCGTGTGGGTGTSGGTGTGGGTGGGGAN